MQNRERRRIIISRNDSRLLRRKERSCHDRKRHHYIKAVYHPPEPQHSGAVCHQPQFYQGEVKKGLRNSDGTGVLVGVSKVGSVQGYLMQDGQRLPAPGRLYYRGIELTDIVEAHRSAGTFGFEEVAYLLLMGYLRLGSLTSAGLTELGPVLAAHGWTAETALCMLVLCLLHFPCGTTCLTILRETGSARWTALAAALPTAMGMALCMLIHGAVTLLG